MCDPVVGVGHNLFSLPPLVCHLLPTQLASATPVAHLRSLLMPMHSNLLFLILYRYRCIFISNPCLYRMINRLYPARYLVQPVCKMHSKMLVPTILLSHFPPATADELWAAPAFSPAHCPLCAFQSAF